MEMNRRDALKAGLAGLLSAMMPFRVSGETKSKPGPVKDGMLFARGDFETYVVNKGILWVPGMPAFLFQDMGMTVHTDKDVLGRPGRTDVSVSFNRIVAPLRPYCKAIHHWGDLHKQSRHPMPLHVGLIREPSEIKDNHIDPHLWFTVQRPVLTQLGATVAAGKDDGCHGAMAVGELICFQGFGEPEMRDKPRMEELTKFRPISDAEMKMYIPTWPNWSGFGLPGAERKAG